MIQIKKVVSAVAGAGLVLALSATSTFAATTITISGNGNGSHNGVVTTDVCANIIGQKNSTNVVTVAQVSSNTGGNKANSNTGGTVSIDTGTAASAVEVAVEGGSNIATSTDCCECVGGTSSVTIENNGNNSHNGVVDTRLLVNLALQKNKTNVATIASVKANTGKNKATKNTGSGVSITTLEALSSLGVSVTAPSNTLNP